MFAREKPLPQPVLIPDIQQHVDLEEEEGILLGSAYWNPELLPIGDKLTSMAGGRLSTVQGQIL